MLNRWQPERLPYKVVLAILFVGRVLWGRASRSLPLQTGLDAKFFEGASSCLPAVVFAVSTWGWLSARAADKLNILLILSEDLGYCNFSSMENGQVRNPNID